MKTISDGSTADYYELPEGAAELQDLISHRNMNAQIGEIFRACYRYGLAEHSSMLRDAKKIAFYAQAEVERLEQSLEKDGWNVDLGAEMDRLREQFPAVEDVKPVAYSKPSWEESPECANWLAQDRDGIWRWFSDKPSPMYGYWGRGHVGSIVKWAGLGDYNLNWHETLEERPGKPSWDDAPEWAQWLSQGADGAWKFHSTRPKFFDGWGWLSTCLDKQIFAGHGKPNPRWHETLESRP